MARINVLIKLLLLLLFVPSLMITTVHGFEDSMQYHYGSNLSDIWFREWAYHKCSNGDYGYGDSDFTLETIPGYPYLRRMHLYTFAYSDRPGGGALHGFETVNHIYGIQGYDDSDYLAFVVQGYSQSHIDAYDEGILNNRHCTGYYPYPGSTSNVTVYWYSSGGYCVGIAHISPYLPTYHDNSLYELYREGDIIYLSIDGESKGSVGGGDAPGRFFSLKSLIETSTVDPSYTHIHISDMTTSSGFVALGTEILGSQTWVEKHEINELVDPEIDVKWHMRTIPKSSYTSSEYTLKVVMSKNGTVVNTTVLKEAGNSTTKPAGYLKYNWTQLFGLEGYGLYKFNLYKDTSLIGSDYIFYKDLNDASWIDIERDVYGIGDDMKVTYYMDNPDFTSNDYFIRIYDASGEKKEEREVSSDSGTETFSTLGFEEGTAYAVLVKDTSPSTSYEDDRDIIEMAIDVANMLEGVFIHGTTYNAETGQPLPNVTINFTQAGNEYNTVSDANGTYEFLGGETGTEGGDIPTSTNTYAKFARDVEINVNASKVGYWHDNFSFTPLRSGTLTIDLYLLPNCENLTHTGYTIAGMTLSYPFHQAVGDANVHIENETTWSSDTVSSTDMGYYIFDNLPVGPMKEQIENETFNSSEYDTWISLVHENIIPGSQKVTNTTDETPFEENIDYEMNYADGKIKVLSSGNMTNNTLYHIDYEYYTGNTYKFYTNATRSRYKPSSVYTTEFDHESEECQYQNIILHGLYELTIYAKDAETHFSLTDFSAIFNDDEQKESGSSTYITFDVEYGIWKVQVDKSGYYSQVKYIYVADDTNVTFYLTRIENESQYPSGPGAYYAPHSVEFRFQDLFGNPVSGATVNATPIETTMGSWEWLQNLYGYSSDIDLHNTTLNGTTGSDGTVTFTMVETIKYRVTVDDKQRGITKTIDIYPKDDHYTIVVGFLISSTNRDAEINATFTTHEINDTARVFNVLYVDTGNKTESVNFTVYAKPTDEVGNFTLIHSETKTGSTVNFSYIGTNWRNTTYYIGYEATMDDGTKRSETRGYEYHMRHILWDLGLEEDEYQYYTWISIALLILVGAMFSGITVRYGAVFVPMFALLLWYVGWLRFAGDIGILGVAMVLGVLFYYKEKSREEAMG